MSAKDRDFTLLFGSETASRLLERWPTAFKAKFIRLAETLTPTPLLNILLSFAKQNREGSEAQDSPDWDSDTSSFLLLLHLLSPQASGRKKIHKISVCQAVDHLVVFHKTCRSIHISYALPLKNRYTFVQTTVYGIDVGTTSERPRVKELRAKFLNDV
ncbi:uncharacterized protein LOC113115051 [Tachysurus ichikawai]